MLYTDKPFEKISEKIKNDPDNFRYYEALYVICKEEPVEETGYKWTLTAKLKDLCADGIRKAVKCQYNLTQLFREVLLLEARGLRFDSYMQYVELDREPTKRFWLPRRKQLLPVVNLIQELIDNKLDVLTISLPPGTGKSTLEIFLLSMYAGAYPDDYSLVASYSGLMAGSIYQGVIQILTNDEYLWGDVFPNAQVITSVKNCTIDVGKKHRFSTLTCRGIDQSITGMTRCNRLLCCDDLVQNREEAVNAQRLDKLWQTYTTDLKQRKQGSQCKELHLATRWSVRDPIGRIEQTYIGNERVKCYAFPATDEDGNSNFDYMYDCGFSSAFYADIRETMEEADYLALYMNEPIERKGLLYPEYELRRYFELPGEEKSPDAIISVCDTKDKGTDYCVHLIAYLYGENVFIEDVVCDNALPQVVEPKILQRILRHNVQMSRFESNAAGGRVAQDMQTAINKEHGRTKITTKFSTQNKETKILANSAWVKEHCLFKDKSVIGNDKDYKRFLAQLCSYTHEGKNKHDDAPDACAMLAEYAQSFAVPRVKPFQRWGF
ncbi:MAG: phage terminase large subunit [Clostridia bacterium]|nr:phage terminase large subunit [Clostridia bacterium]